MFLNYTAFSVSFRLIKISDATMDITSFETVAMTSKVLLKFFFSYALGTPMTLGVFRSFFSKVNSDVIV